MSGPVLAVEGLTVHYGAIEALRGISLEVPAGEVVALIGANGAGKTTTLRAISKMLQPSRGRVSFLGEDVTRLPSHRLVARGMAHAPEGRGIFLNLTVRENLEVGAFLRRDRAGHMVLAVLNCTPVPRHNHRVGVPRGGAWHELLNSDHAAYGGSGQGNLGGVEAAPVAAGGRPFSLNLVLPPLGAVFLAPRTREA